ncbi:DEAD/DEAH box helicase [Dictyobacter arantiisoli]|uniref:DEAD/DEAH box helicase n=1 Tax=Dictyobacter arantiisoli TaxID=2014874 RepID=UPI0011ED4A55|nr:DEAD/DEAH box helicase [Dictyobacter arantiisoli]
MTEHDPRADIQTFAARYTFPIDAFQLEAMEHLAHGQSVMVAAPTGTGKTLVAEYAIWRAQQQGQRVIYTTPLKALSNQKYRDLREQYGADAVGLVTGDIVERSKASIVIMTTEVYRNMLLEQGSEHLGTGVGPSSLADVGYIVFDELHYLSDVGRGPVWEEAIICSPPHIQLVGLSATVSNAEDLASWISRVHRPVSLVTHNTRAVPLEHYYFLDGKLHLVQDADGNRVERFPKVGGEAKLAQMLGRNRVFSFEDDEEGEEEEDLEKILAENRQRRNHSMRPQDHRVSRKERERNQTDRRPRTPVTRDAAKAQAILPEVSNSLVVETTHDSAYQETPRPTRPKQRRAPESGEVLTALRDANMLPCLYFLPGRRVVEEGAMSAGKHSFTTPEEQDLIRKEVEVWLEQLPKEDRNLQQVRSLLNLLPRGLAFHHAGLLPGLKVLVETLFARGHLRAVFSTDTLALGINMPAHSVVVGSLSKFDGQEMRLLTPNEYLQLTGRAGRRGMDTSGAVIIPYSPWEPFESSFEKITGEMLPVTSSFVIRYNSVLNLWRPNDLGHLRRICASSLREYQRYYLWEVKELQRLEKRYQKASKAGKKKKGAASQEAERALDKRREKIGAFPLSRAGAAELDGTIFALRALGHIGQDEQLTLKGRLLRNIFHPAGTVMVEMIVNGYMDGLTPAEVAEVCSWFTYDNDRRLNNRHVMHNRLTQVRRELWHVIQHVRGVEERAGISFTPGVVSEFHGLALAWARNMSLSGLMKRIDLVEGDIMMILNQTIDLLQQLQSAVGQVLDSRDIWSQISPVMVEGIYTSSNTSDYIARRDEELQQQRNQLEYLRPMLAQASASLLHGIIAQSRTVPSMAVQVDTEDVPLDAEEDRDAQGLSDPGSFVGDI